MAKIQRVNDKSRMIALSNNANIESLIMTKNINHHEFISKIASLKGKIDNLLQDEFFDNWLLAKRNHLIQRLAEINFDKTQNVFLGYHLHAARSLDNSVNFINLDKNFLLNPPKNLPDNSIVILLNNDVAKHLQLYIDYYNSNPNAIFIVWDWDSQHWIQMSSIVAMYSDFYISATSENASILSQFSPNIVGPVFACVHQWTKKFILQNLDILLKERLNTPLGMHVYYEKYIRRNRAIATVNKVFSTVSFANNDFKNKSEMENLIEWSNHKSHWIMPVMSGVPIRVYNALICGGIPILPKSYQNLPEVGILGSTPFYYETNDLIDPKIINDLAITSFDKAGESGLISRICDAINNHHVDGRCRQIIYTIEGAINRIKSNDRTYQCGYIGVNGF
jgi:hypothetical protein